MMSDHKYIEELTASVVREFLSRKNLSDTFAALEKELPRTQSSISSRSVLIKSVHLERQFKKNKDSSEPLRTVLEVIINYLLEKNSKSDHLRRTTKSDDNTPGEKIPLTILQKERTGANSGDIGIKKNSENFLKSSLEMKRSSLSGSKAAEGIQDLRSEKFRIGSETFDAAPKSRAHRRNVFKEHSQSSTEKEEMSKNTSQGSKANDSSLRISKDLPPPNVPSKLQDQKNINKEFPKNTDRKLNQVGDLEVEDLDDCETEGTTMKNAPNPTRTINNLSQSTRTITLKDAIALRLLLFGRQETAFSYEWMKQGFTFNSQNPQLYYGLIQHRGGPCGVLAAVQSFALRYLFFESKMKESTNVKLSKSRNSLVHAIAHILWKAGSKKKSALTLPSPRAKFALGGRYKADGLLECLVIHTFTDYSELLNCVQNNISEFENDKSGCVLVVYSAVLSRGIDRLKEDMDDPQNLLMGAHGYCSQEMVNLLLTGVASSNVFNNTIELDSGGGKKSVLKGISERSEIGFMSLFEHYNSCEVGSLLKTPIYPIWIICSESHFSVLFGLDQNLVAASRQKSFDLYYYDGLAQQDGEIKLTVDPSTAPSYSDLIPPLDHCIRTKWKNVSISWNGSEPML